MIGIGGTDVLREVILELVSIQQKDPYALIWRRLFVILYKIKRNADLKGNTVILYQVNGYDMIYTPDERKFKLQAGGIIFTLKIDELVTGICEGRFLPS